MKKPKKPKKPIKPIFGRSWGGGYPDGSGMLGGSGVPWGVQQSSGIRPGAPQTIVLRALDLPGDSLIAMHQLFLIMSLRQ